MRREIVRWIDEELHGFAVQDKPLALDGESFDVEEGRIRQIIVNPHSFHLPIMDHVGIGSQNGIVDFVEGTQGNAGIAEQDEKRVFFRIAVGVLEESQGGGDERYFPVLRLHALVLGETVLMQVATTTTTTIIIIIIIIDEFALVVDIGIGFTVRAAFLDDPRPKSWLREVAVRQET